MSNVISAAQAVQLINVVVPDVRCVSGTVSKDGTDDQAYTNGSVRYIDPKELSYFTSARSAAGRICRQNGARFLSGYAIADDRLDKVLASLEEIAIEVASKKSHLIANYDAMRADWLAKNPSISTWATKFPEIGYVDRQTGMSVAVYKISPFAMKPESSLDDGVAQELAGLPWQILQEIAQDVSVTWQPGAQRVTQRIKGLLTRVRDKLRSLEFLGGNLRTISQAIEDVMMRLPSSGPIEGADFVLLTGLLHSLSDPNRIVNELSGMVDHGMSVEDLWGVKPAEVEPEPEPVQSELVVDVQPVQVVADPISVQEAVNPVIIQISPEEGPVIQAEPVLVVSQTATTISEDAYSW